MCRIKICGIQRVEDVDYINRCLPEYAGFIFAPSRRRVDVEHARCLIRSMDGRIKKVGVFVNEEVEEVISVAKLCGLDVLQLHGEEAPEQIAVLKDQIDSVEVWKAVRIQGIESMEQLSHYQPDAFLLDSYSKESYGGTGKTFDWSIAARVSEKYRVVLAGGLYSGNVVEARNMVRPYCIDVSSGVETEGYKDDHKIREFIYTARAY